MHLFAAAVVYLKHVFLMFTGLLRPFLDESRQLFV